MNESCSMNDKIYNFDGKTLKISITLGLQLIQKVVYLKDFNCPTYSSY